MKRFLLDPANAAGKLYSPVIISPGAIARVASSAETLGRVLAICAQLAPDPYTHYVSQFYRQGLQLAGEHWRFMDIMSVLNAVSVMGLPENYLEIGVRRGRSVCAVIAASACVDIYAFDMWQENYANNANPGPELVQTELAKFGYTGTITFVDGDSHQTVPEYLENHPNLTFDLITVDGDHSAKGAIDDLQNVVSRLRVGGVLVFDDTANPYCPRLMAVWRRFLKSEPNLIGYSYNELGTGISFAIRMRSGRTAAADDRSGGGLLHSLRRRLA